MKLFNIKLLNSNIHKGLITSGFGWRLNPITKKKQFHNGVDIALSEGTPLFAPHDARIEWNWHHIGGLQCILYWKTENLKIRLGLSHLLWVDKNLKWVKKGDLIAKTGNTGRSTGPHLHLTIATWTRDGWTFLDPLVVIDGWELPTIS